MPEAKKAHAVGFNHVALEVGDIKEALAFYGRLFEFELRGKSRTSAFIDLGDQFISLDAARRLTAGATLASLSTTRIRSVKRWPKPGSKSCLVRFWTSWTLGETGS